MQSGAAADLSGLLVRIRQRMYAESVPVLASWWLKTVYYAGHNRVWWDELDSTIEELLKRETPGTAAEAIKDIQLWVRQAILSQPKAPKVKPLLSPPFRPELTPDQAAPYLSRVLNEWLPAEIARLLTSEAEFAGSNESGMPALAVATAFEQLLLREHHSPASLELLLKAAWLSPKWAYPADVEVFCDVVHALLGRTAAPVPPVLPAIHLAGEFADGVRRALLVASEDGDELHVPLGPSQALEILKHDPLRIGSIVVTMDGRWWESARLQRGQETVIAYRPGGRLRIDFSCEHARLVVPWPNSEARSPGVVHLPEHVSLFGRKWRGRAWERSAERTWLHLEFSSALTLSEGLMSDNPRPHRLRPASIEIAWSEVEQALAREAPDSVDQLHRTDLIPLARSLERLVRYLLRPWLVSLGELDKSLRSVRYLHGAIATSYGPIPWRVLPARPRTALLKRCGDTALVELCAEIFDGAPPENELRAARCNASRNLESSGLIGNLLSALAAKQAPIQRSTRK
jgi:hypothetical protein